MVDKFGDGLKMIRKSKKLTQEVLASLSSLERTYISNLERNKQTPTLNTVIALATAFEMKAYELIREIENHSDK